MRGESELPMEQRGLRTTMSVSLGLDGVVERARICDGAAGRAALLAERAAVRITRGAILLAMMGGLVFNGKKKRNRRRISSGWADGVLGKVDVVKRRFGEAGRKPVATKLLT